MQRRVVLGGLGVPVTPDLGMESFHFLRPWWLLLMPLAGWLIYRMAKQRGDGGLWRKVCDPVLLERLLVGKTEPRRQGLWWILAGGFFLAIVALAGPVWQQLEQPMYRQQQALIVLLDLSRSMLADDVKPNRLGRAKEKLSDLLRLRHEGQTALVVYAAEPFTITPLTNDSRTILQQLPVLEPDMMPAQGSRLDKALALALRMFRRSGVAHGDVLVLSDGVGAAGEAAATLRRHGHRVSVLALGTVEGAPIPAPSGLVTDEGGNIVLARLDMAAMQAVAAAGGGLFDSVRLGDGDLQRLQALMGGSHRIDKGKQKAVGDHWREEGPWLLLALLPLAALAFRRGWLLAVALLVMLPAPATAWEWDGLWRNHDQQGERLWQQKQYAKAAAQFRDPAWQGVARYRSGDYSAALKALGGDDTADGWYNRGNALAKAGKFDQALKAYDEALKRDPKAKDARFNRDLMKKLKQQQQKPQKKKNKQRGKGQKNAAGDKKQQGGKKGSDKQQSGKQGQQSKSQSDDKRGQGAKPGEKLQQSAAEGRKDGKKPQGAEKQQKMDKAGDKGGDKKQSVAKQMKSEAQPDQGKMERQQARQQWLRRIPDDPGGLLRRKFLYQYKKQGDGHQ
ncbi:MAG: VWA domain-containing protein [Mariprofundales bacterium]